MGGVRPPEGGGGVTPNPTPVSRAWRLAGAVVENRPPGQNEPTRAPIGRAESHRGGEPLAGRRFNGVRAGYSKLVSAIVRNVGSLRAFVHSLTRSLHRKPQLRETSAVLGVIKNPRPSASDGPANFWSSPSRDRSQS